MGVSQGTGVISRLKCSDIGDGEHTIEPTSDGGVRRSYGIVLLYICKTGVRCVQTDAGAPRSIGLVSNGIFQGVLKYPKDVAEIPSDVLQRRPLGKAWKPNCASRHHLFSVRDCFKIRNS